MPFVPFANCAEVVFQGKQANQAMFMTFGVQKGSAMSPTDLSTIANIFAAWYTAELKALISTNYDPQEVKVTDLSSDSAPIFELDISGLGAGSVASAAVPNNVALVMSLKTDNRGRSYRGRNYIPGVPAADLNSNTDWESSSVGTFVAAWETLATDLGIDGYTHVVLSRRNGGVERSVGVATRVTSYVGRTAMGTQRRRVAGVGI